MSRPIGNTRTQTKISSSLFISEGYPRQVCYLPSDSFFAKIFVELSPQRAKGTSDGHVGSYITALRCYLSLQRLMSTAELSHLYYFTVAGSTLQWNYFQPSLIVACTVFPNSITDCRKFYTAECLSKQDDEIYIESIRCVKKYTYGKRGNKNLFNLGLVKAFVK